MRWLLPLVVVVVSGCVADLEQVQSGADASVADAAPADGTIAPTDASPLDATAPDATPDATQPTETASCTVVRGPEPITLSGVTAEALDLAPSGDRLLVDEGDQLSVYALPEGRLLYTVRGETGALSRSGRTLVFDAGGGHMVGTTDGQLLVPLFRNRACEHRLTPDRRALVALTWCSEEDIGPMGVLDIAELETLTVTVDASGIAGGSIQVTPAGVRPTRISALQNQPFACGCPGPQFVRVEFDLPTLTTPPNLPSPPTSYARLLGYDATGDRLIAQGRGCACGVDEAPRVWDARADVGLVATAPLTAGEQPPLDQPRDWTFSRASLLQFGFDGMLVSTPWIDRSLSYVPYASGAARTVLTRVLPSSAAVLLGVGRDEIVLLGNHRGDLLRVRLETNPIMNPALLARGAPGNNAGLFVSADRGKFAVLASGAAPMKLLIADANGPPFIEAQPLIAAHGFVPGGHGFAATFAAALQTWADGAWTRRDERTSTGGPVATDAQGCWLAHAREGAVAEVRVVPLFAP